MELITIAWVVIFLLFALSLLLVWSKVYIIAGKIKAIDALVGRCETIDSAGTGTAADKPVA